MKRKKWSDGGNGEEKAGSSVVKSILVCIVRCLTDRSHAHVVSRAEHDRGGARGGVHAVDKARGVAHVRDRYSEPLHHDQRSLRIKKAVRVREHEG